MGEQFEKTFRVGFVAFNLVTTEDDRKVIQQASVSDPDPGGAGISTTVNPELYCRLAQAGEQRRNPWVGSDLSSILAAQTKELVDQRTVNRLVREEVAKYLRLGRAKVRPQFIERPASPGHFRDSLTEKPIEDANHRRESVGEGSVQIEDHRLKAACLFCHLHIEISKRHYNGDLLILTNTQHQVIQTGHTIGQADNGLLNRCKEQSLVELPVFNDNHKSSGGWMTQLASEYDLYQEWVERRGHSGAKLSFGPDQTDDMPVGNVPALIDTWAAAPDSYLDSSRLGHINRLLSGTDLTNDLYRQGQPTLLSPQHDPAPASMLPRLLDLAFDWFRTEGFAELHPLEQATLVYLRLLDLSPFATANESTALAAAGFYTRRRGYPALILLNGTSEDESSRYRLALEAAFGMLTQPLVELFADALIRTMRTEREDRR